MGKIYAEVGSFAMRPGTEKGIHLFEYDPETAAFTPIEDHKPEINAGQNSYNAKADVLYITHESKDPGAGAVLALKLDHETGKAQWMNRVSTLSNLPSYVCCTQSCRYAIVPHHGVGVTIARTIQYEDGSYGLRYDSDDATVALISLNEDGSLGEVCDVYWVQPERKGEEVKFSHLHCCEQSPDGKMFIICDKGLDKVHTFRLDEEEGKLIYLDSAQCLPGNHPRYAKFHPTLPVVYQNNEASAFVNVWEYDSVSGRMTQIQRIGMLGSEEASAAWTHEGASDMRVTADGKYLYAAVRGVCVIAVYAIGEDGTLTFLQNIDSQGKNPRGLALSPDERFLFSMNRDEACVARFKREADGTLTAAGNETKAPLPGNMQFIEY